MQMSHRAQIPRTEADLAQGQYNWVWIVQRCPYCDRPHAHYGGALDTDPALSLDHPLPAKCAQHAHHPPMRGTATEAVRYVLQAAPPAERVRA